MFTILKQLSTTYKLLQTLFIKYNSQIFMLTQLTFICMAFTLYPTFECFLTVVFWCNLLVVFNLLYFFDMPILIITGSFFLVVKSICSFNSGLLFNIFFYMLGLLLILSILFYIFKDSALYDFAVKELKTFTSLETKVSIQFKNEFTSFGSLILMTTWIFLVFNFAGYVDAGSVLLALNTHSKFFVPFGALYSCSLILSGFIELLVYSSAEFSLSLVFFGYLFRLGKILGGLFIQSLTFHSHCVGGDYDPLTCIKFVRNYQKSFFGAVATNTLEVNALRQFKNLNQVSPPCIDGTDFVDIVKLESLINCIIEKQKSRASEIKKCMDDVSTSFRYEAKLSDADNFERLSRELTLCNKVEKALSSVKR